MNKVITVVTVMMSVALLGGCATKTTILPERVAHTVGQDYSHYTPEEQRALSDANTARGDELRRQWLLEDMETQLKRIEYNTQK